MRSQERGLRLSKNPRRALIFVKFTTWSDFTINLHGCWIAKGLSQVALDSILWRKVDLFEQLGRNGDATGCSNLLQRGVTIGVCVTGVVNVFFCVVVIIGVIHLLTREVLLNWGMFFESPLLGSIIRRHFGFYIDPCTENMTRGGNQLFASRKRLI